MLPRRLGPKLNLAVLAFLALLAGVTAVIVYVGSERTQHEGTESSRRGLEQQARDTILRDIQFQSSFGGAQLEATGGLAQEAAAYFGDPAVQATAPPLDPARIIRAGNGIGYDASPTRRTDAAIPVFATVNDAVLRDMRDSSVLEHLFPVLLAGYTGQTRSEDFDAIAIYFDSVNNVTRMYPRFENIEALPADADVRARLTMAGPEQNPERRVVWSMPYEDAAGRGLVLTAFAPVYTGDEFRGTIGVDLSLARLINQIDLIRPTPGGYAFYVDRDGNLLNTASAPVVQEAIEDDRNDRFAATLAAMREGRAGVDNGNLGGEEVFIGYYPVPGPGGTLAVVAPIDEITAQAEAVAESIEREQNRTLGITLSVMAAFFVIALGVATWMNRRFLLRPVEALVRGTHAVAAGDLNARIPVESNDELGELAGSFNAMTAELQQREAVLQQRETALREEVSERRRTQDELRAVLAALEDVVVVLDKDGRCLRIAPTNPSFRVPPHEAMLGLTLHEMTDRPTADALLEKIQLALRDRRTQYGEYEVHFPEDTYWLAFTVSPLTDDTVVWVARDITERVAARQNLERRVEERTRELSALLAVSRTATSSLDLKRIVALILDDLKGVADYSGCSFLMLDGSDLVIVDSRSPFADRREEAIIDMRFPTSAAGRLWETVSAGEPVIIDDVRGDSDYAADYRKIVGDHLPGASLAYIRSWVAVPVAIKDRITGILTASSTQTGYFTDDSAHLIHGFASQVAAAVDNARLFEQTEERTRELAALLDVSRAITSTLELEPLLKRILVHVRDTVGFDRGAFLLRDGEELITFAVMSADDLDATVLSNEVGMRYHVGDDEALWRRLGSGEAVFIDDIAEDTPASRAYKAAIGDRFDWQRVGIRGWLGVPLGTKERMIGMLVLSSSTPGFYTRRHADLSLAIANQTAAAIENARLFEQSEMRAREMSALLDVSRAITSTLDLQSLLRLILEQVRDTVDFDRAAFLLLEEDELVVLAVMGAHGVSNDELQDQIGLRFPAGEGATLWEPVGRGEPVIIDDILIDTPMGEAYRGAVRGVVDYGEMNVRSWLGVPLGSKDRVIGMLAMSYAQPSFYSERHANLAMAIANQAAAAIQNARLFEQTERSRRELAALLDVSRAITSTLDLESLLRLIQEHMRTTIGFDRSAFLLRDGNDLTVISVMSGTTGRDDELRNQIGLQFQVGPESLLWRPMGRGEAVIIDDVEASDEFAEAYRGAVNTRLQWRGEVRSWLAVPLGAREDVIGLLTLSSSDPGFYTQAHADLAMAIANQAAAAIQNARLFEQTQQNAREMSALLEVSHSVASTLELGPLVAVILEQLRLIIDYNGASVLMLHGDELVIQDFGSAAVPDSTPRQRPFRFSLESMGVTWEHMLRGETFIIDDVRSDHPHADQFRLATGDRYDTSFRHVRSWVAVPLIVGDNVIGLLALSHGEPGFFTQDNTKLARAVADQAAVAIENARLFGETERGRREMEALFRADSELFRSLSLDAVLQAIVDVTVDVLRVDKSILTFISDGAERIRAWRNFSDAGLQRLGAQVAEAGRSPQSGQFRLFVLDDTHQDPRPDVRQIWLDEGIASWMGMPIRDGDRTMGAFGVGYTEPHRFTDDEKRVFEALAERSGVAIKNARLYERAQQAASLEERQRLARELHDSVSQALYGIALGARTARTQLDRDPAKAVEPVEYVLSLAEAGLAEMRALIFELRPESLESEGLVAALSKQVASTQARYGIKVDAEFPEEPSAPLPVKEGLYRIGQEALHNIVKHARATHVDLRLSAVDGELTMMIQDNGAGFDPSGEFPGHLGLRSMRERAEKLGGTLEIDSAPGKGATIMARIKLQANGQAPESAR